ncbi:MAG: hypothetical protein GC164_07390 [Phycisphaera sp.]|nr:hypothetical protein [Phycisphaera sp.]
MTYQTAVTLSFALLPALLLVTGFSDDAIAGEEARKDTLTQRDYFLYTPEQIDPAKTYWLVVGVHGWKGNGKGAGGLAGWVNKFDCIVVGPSFPNDGYQTLGFRSDEQLIAIAGELGKQYKLHPKLYIHGFSGGAQYAHRFMMKYPQYVVGCSSHSAGSWATGGPWLSVNPQAKGVPFVMSCGEADTNKSFDGAPYTRIEWAKLFESQIKEAGFFYAVKFFPNVGHKQTGEVGKMNEECFVTATQLMPFYKDVFNDLPRLERMGKRDEALKLAQSAYDKEPMSEDGLSQRLIQEARVKLEPILKRLQAAQPKP